MEGATWQEPESGLRSWEWSPASSYKGSEELSHPPKGNEFCQFGRRPWAQERNTVQLIPRFQSCEALSRGLKLSPPGLLSCRDFELISSSCLKHWVCVHLLHSNKKMNALGFEPHDSGCRTHPYPHTLVLGKVISQKSLIPKTSELNTGLWDHPVLGLNMTFPSH